MYTEVHFVFAEGPSYFNMVAVCFIICSENFCRISLDHIRAFHSDFNAKIWFCSYSSVKKLNLYTADQNMSMKYCATE